MKILHVAPIKLRASGPTSVLIPLLKELCQGHDIGLISTNEAQGELLVEKINNNKIKCYNVSFEKTKISTNPKKWLEENIPDIQEYDLVHFHGVFQIKQSLMARGLKKIGIPYIISPHGNLMKEALKHKKIKKKLGIFFLLGRYIREANFIHALAKEEEENILDNFPNARIFNIPNGTEIISNEIKAELSNQKDVFNIVFLGRLDVHHKGLDILIEAVKILIGKNVKDFKIQLVGPINREEDKRYFQKNLDSSLQEHIQLVGPKYGSEKEDILSHCDFVIHTSRYEGMPMSILESMGMGKPVIVTNGTNMTQIIEQSKGGIISQRDPEDVAVAIEKALKMDKKEIKLMGENSKNWCFSYHKWKGISDDYTVFYNHLLKV
ncbi:MAG: hypothetical protein PME_10250 [Priestia megaterium]